MLSLKIGPIYIMLYGGLCGTTIYGALAYLEQISFLCGIREAKRCFWAELSRDGVESTIPLLKYCLKSQLWKV